MGAVGFNSCIEHTDTLSQRRPVTRSHRLDANRRSAVTRPPYGLHLGLCLVVLVLVRGPVGERRAGPLGMQSRLHVPAAATGAALRFAAALRGLPCLSGAATSSLGMVRSSGGRWCSPPSRYLHEMVFRPN